jgi:hypothetical protein
VTIRKISGRTTSLAVKATVTQGGIFKAALQQPTGIQSLQNKSSTLIPKIANVTHRVINHLLYDPEGFGIRHVYDWLSINTDLNFGFGKSLGDSASPSDVLISRLVKNREPADAFSTTEQLNFLLRTRRTFDHAAVLLDTPSLGLRKPVADTQSFTDFFLISRVKNFDETLTGSDTFGRVFKSYRTFEDTVGMLDAFVFIDGSTFELRRRLSDTVTINSTNVELLRNSGNETENFSFFIDKVLDPDMELLDQISKLGLKSITDVDITSADRPFLYTSKPLTDTPTLLDLQPSFVGLKSTTDLVTIGTAAVSGGVTDVGGAAVFTGSPTWQIATSSAFTYGTNDFTIEFWAYQTGASGVQGIQRTSTGDAAFSSGYCTITMPSQRLNITQGNGAGGYFVISSNTTIALNTWHHYAYVRNSGVCKLYVDGIAQTGTFTNTSSIPAQVGIMQIGNAGGPFTGRLTNFRIVNGTAVYTSNFTPSTTPLTAITNTKLLLLMSSSGGIAVDSGPLNFTLTPTGGGPTYTSSTPLISSTVATTRLSGDTLENFSYWLDKYLTDFSIMLDSMSFGDQLAYDSTKLLSDILTETDRPYLWFAPATRTETISLADANRSRFTKANTDSADLTESNTKYIGKHTNSIFSLADILNITRLRDFADVFTPTDFNQIALTKIFADTVEADDPLIRLSDGNISLLIKQNRSTQPADDYFARAVKFYRYPHHNDGGLGNFVPVLEDDSKYVNLRARAGALTTYPIIRTNLIAWSEQFNADQSQGYWTSIGTRIISNQTAAPQNVVSSNSTTYDADQLQELFYNKPNTSYARSWYQIAPGRWVASSDGDLLVQDTSTGTHQLSSPNIPELIGTTNFGFSIHLKYAGHRYVRLWVTSFVNVDVDMVNNVVVATSAGKASMQPVGGGWFLVQLENRIVNFGIAPEMQILNEIFYNSTNSPYGLTQYKLVPDNIISSARIVLLDSSLNTTFTGNGTDGVYVWGAQLEVGDQPEQEVSSLRYIRTAGGSATRIGFSVTPTDNDRVFVGRIQRRGGQEVRNDPFEVISLLLQYRVPVASHLAIPTDYFARSVRYFRDRVTEPGLGDSFAAGNGNSLRRYSNDPLELISFWFNKDAKKAGTSTATRQTVVRQNLLKWSERFDYDYWTKSNVRASTGISIIGGSLPYRNVVHDADQIHGLFYNKKYTYNQGRRWWDVIPLSTATRADFTSNTIVDIFESSSNSIHTVQTFGFATNLSGDFFASSIYASPANGVTRFRLQVGSVFADFDLSSIAVLSSVGTLYNKIVQADTSTGWYLCTIIGPTQALGTLNFTGDAAVPTDLLQKLIPFRAAPDSILPTDQRPIFFGSKYFADTTTMLSNFYIADGSTYTGNKQILDSFVAGTLEGFRTSGNQVENVKFLTKFVAHRSGEFTSLTIKLINDVRGSAAKVAEDVFVNRTNKTWFQLAPYYRSSVHIDDYPTDYDRVRIGSQSGGPRGSNDPFETINLLVSRFFVNKDSVVTTDRKLGNFIGKQIDETKLIPTIPKFDAAAVAGLFYNTTRNIDGRRYTPQDGNYTYYAKTDWYSLAPRYARPRFAWGTGNTPGTIMIDNMQLGDDLTYLSQFNLKTTVLIGSPDGVRGTSDIENFSYNLNMRPRRGAFTDLYIAKQRPTKFDADQTAGIFWGSSNSTTSYTKLNPYGKRWFQLAPYYASYEHFKNSPGQYDFVRVGSVRGGQRHLGWPTEIMSLGMLKTPYETSVTTDVRGNFFNLTALRGDTNAGTGYWTTRTNYISSSGVFTGADWIKSNITLSSNSEQIFYDPVSSGYRSTLNDANQVVEMFYSPKNNTAGKRWYDIVPVRPQTLTPLILDKIPILTETTSVGQHYMETVVNKPVTADQYYLFRVIALTRSGTNNIRVYINNDYADFTLYGATAVSVSNTNMTSFTATYGAYGGALGLLGRTTSTSVTVRIQLIDQSGNTSYAGTTANSVWVWGAQLEFGEYFNPTNQILVYNSLKNPGDYYRNSWIKSTNGPTSRLYEIFGTDTRTDGVTIGLDQDARLGGSSRENVSFKTLLRARRSGNSTSILITLGSITRTSADQTAEVFDNIKTSTPIMNKWYQLAPYYRSSLYDRDTDYDRVRIGSQTRSKRTSSDPYETLSFWLAPKPLTDSSTVTDIKTRQYIRKEFSETRMIPNNPRFDAARVAGLELYSTSSQNINLSAYTPLSGGTQYYKARDWYSEAPLSNRSKFAIGNAGTGPVMLDNFLFGDVFTYTGTKLLSSIALTVGTQLTSVNLVYQLPTYSISSVLVTSLTQNLVLNSEYLRVNWSTSSMLVSELPAPIFPGAPDGGSSHVITSIAPVGVGKLFQRLARPITSGNYISVSAYVRWNSITSGDVIRFGVGINSSNVTHGVQINVINQISPTTSVVTYFVTQAEPVTPWYRVQFALQAPTRLTYDNTRIIFEHTSGSSINFSVWGVQIAEALVAPTYRPTSDLVLDSQSIYNYTQISSAVSSTNIGTKYSNDPAETIDVRLNKTAKQGAFTDLYVKNRRISPLDADQVLGLLYNSSNSTRSIIRNNPYRRRWYQLAPYYNSYGHVKSAAQDTDTVLVSYKELFQPWVIKGNNDIASTAGDGGTRKQTGQNSLETTKFNVQLFAQRSALTTSNVVITTKTNWVSYSEDFTGFYWGKTNATTVQAPQLMSGRYPYRNTNYDAVQVANQFMLISTSSAFTRYNNYYNRAWYAPAPLTTRVAFSSTVLQYLTDQDAFGPHYMQAEVQLRDYSIPEEWVTYSLHVQGQAGVRRFRMDVGRCYADFDLSSVSVVTSTQTVRYANIRYVDTSAGVFLCQIIAPIQTFPNTLIRFAVSSDTVTAADSGINFLFRDKRTFDDAVVSTESINNDKITDYHL